MTAKRIAVLGASANRARFGNKAVRAFRDAGWTVYPVNTHEQSIEGIAAFPRLTEIPGSIDVVSVYLPPPVGATVIDDIISTKPGEVFLNPGAESEYIVSRLEGVGVPVRLACSIRSHGMDPDVYGA